MLPAADSTASPPRGPGHSLAASTEVAVPAVVASPGGDVSSVRQLPAGEGAGLSPGNILLLTNGIFPELLLQLIFINWLN